MRVSAGGLFESFPAPSRTSHGDQPSVSFTLTMPISLPQRVPENAPAIFMSRLAAVRNVVLYTAKPLIFSTISSSHSRNLSSAVDHKHLKKLSKRSARSACRAYVPCDTVARTRQLFQLFTREMPQANATTPRKESLGLAGQFRRRYRNASLGGNGCLAKGSNSAE